MDPATSDDLLKPKSVKVIETHLDDLIHISNSAEAARRLKEISEEYDMFPDQVNTARLGMVYHEVARLDSQKTDDALRAYEVLNELYFSEDTFPELRPFVDSYRASALGLLASRGFKPSLFVQAFTLFDKAVANFAALTLCPEFLRARMTDTLPWFLFGRRRQAKKDYESLIAKHKTKPSFASARIMSLVYLGWARLNHQIEHRVQALEYLDLAISLDPRNLGARREAEELKRQMLQL